MNKDNKIDYNSSGFVAQLFSIFQNVKEFCIIESRKKECVICGKNTLDDNLDNKPFIYITLEDLKEKNIFNIILKKYKEIYTYDCDCRKGSSEDILCTKVKYNIISYPKILFVLFDMNYKDLYENKNQIFKLIEENIILNINVEYKLTGIIGCPSFNHYNTIIFNPIGCNIDKNFRSNFIYYHDGALNDGRITQISHFENWQNIGIPYIIVYKFNEK